FGAGRLVGKGHREEQTAKTAQNTAEHAVGGHGRHIGGLHEVVVAGGVLRGLAHVVVGTGAVRVEQPGFAVGALGVAGHGVDAALDFFLLADVGVVVIGGQGHGGIEAVAGLVV